MSTMRPHPAALDQAPPSTDTADGPPTDTNEAAQLAGELRATEWALGDLAHNLPAGRDDPAQALELADRLEKMAVVLRLRALGGAQRALPAAEPERARSSTGRWANKRPDERQDTKSRRPMSQTAASMAFMLRDVAYHRGLSQRQVADLVGVEPSTISRIFGGIRALPSSELDRWARGFGLRWHVHLAWIQFEECQRGCPPVPASTPPGFPAAQTVRHGRPPVSRG